MTKVYGYIRVSTVKQDYENQKYSIMKYCSEKGLLVDEWIKETKSGTVKVKDRVLGRVIESLRKGDVLIVSELSRIGRSLMDVMGILNEVMQKDCKVISIKEGFQLGEDISSKVLAFAFSLSSEIERQLISQRTKEALQRKKVEGKKLGRPKGFRLKSVKLSGREQEIKTLLKHDVSLRAVARLMGVSATTVSRFREREGL